MEALYAKLYDKYTTLKKNKFSELDEVCREQEEKFLNCVTASEALIEHLRSENQDVKATLETLRDEITELRSTRDKERLEYQKRLVEEERKNKALSEQVVKLKELISEGDQSRTKRKTPESPQVTTRSMSKRMKQTEDIVETDTVSPTRSLRKRSRQQQTEGMVETDVASPHHNSTRQKSTTETLLVSQPQCCKTTDVGSSNSAGCPFHALGEHLTGMKLSTSDEGERVCIVASHPSSGLSFTLTWVNNSTGEEEDELLYKVESLGTFQRVVPEWMRDVIKFSTSMIPVFFQRVSRVIKPQD
ncbi:Titan9 [Hirschfeldia incana]|nr:Titan9 [Hirschfeldia incana]